LYLLSQHGLGDYDVNKDVQINDMSQLSGLIIQVKSALGVFRGYVKRIEDIENDN
jgi:hypothetical protein